ncbi:helix-turn-helix domain-containing protein [Mesorhizobium sp. IMUNJ 23232]|uniref:helix-turn-helix domain-containing protein n=1 Tax=Mesorhizobium sp. IMUNJ 23232 TaxID=3376064 RepID=UPI0037BA742A
MTTSIKLFRGAFGHVSVLNVASNFVTHAHAEAHMIIWLDGTAGEMTIGGQTVRLGPGMAACINAFQPHSHALSSDGAPGQFLAFYIDPEWARRRLGLAPKVPLFSVASLPLDNWLYRAAVGLYDELNDGAGDELAGYETERLIDSLIDAADMARPRKARIAGHGAMQDYRVRKAIELMKLNVGERICFDDVARCVGLSRPHFFALFKEQTNLTPNVYWNTLRMEEALKQLQSEDSLTSVACNLGFTSQGNFTRFFRDHAGVPPTLYREAARATA